MNFVFLSCSFGYGHQFGAANYKAEMIVRGLTAQGDTCTLHNGFYGVSGLEKKEDYRKDNVARIVAYPYKGNPKLDFLRNFKKLFRDLKSLKKEGERNILVLASADFYHIYLLYEIIGKSLGYEISVISGEWLPTYLNQHRIRKFSNWVHSKLFGYGVSSILPISEYIINKIRHFDKPYFKTPILAEFTKNPNPNITGFGFSYCATINYRRVLDPVIESYINYRAKSKNPQPLRLILSGPQYKIDTLRDEIDDRYPNNGIEIFTKLPYEELFAIYKSSSALLIPLDPDNEQDWARFSQKIAEYLSTGTPIITTAVGEIPVYFTNGKDAYITDFSAEGFQKAFAEIEANPKKAKEIGLNGFLLGKKEFDAIAFGKTLHDFFVNL